MISIYFRILDPDENLKSLYLKNKWSDCHDGLSDNASLS